VHLVGITIEMNTGNLWRENTNYVLYDNNKNINITDVAVCSMKHNDVVSNNIKKSKLYVVYEVKKGISLRNAP